MSEEQKRPVESLSKRVRVNHVFPKRLETRFANSVVVQHQRENFILSFFEILPPLILADTDGEKRALFDTLEEIEAKCVARLVLTPDSMASFIEAMTENFEGYMRKVSEIDETEDTEDV